MRQPTKKFTTPLEAEDSLAERAITLYQWARDHARALLVAGVALTLLVVAAVYYVDYRRDLEASAAVELEKARTAVSSGNTTLAINDLQRFLSQYGDTDHAREARVMIAALLIQTARPGDALEEIRKIRDVPGSDPIGARAALIAGAALEAMGDTLTAVNHYLRIAEQLRMQLHQREALAAAARLQHDRGDYEGAAASYRKLLTVLPEQSVEHQYYQMRLAEALAQARAGSQQKVGAHAPGEPE